jgi:hypothetical protein
MVPAAGLLGAARLALRVAGAKPPALKSACGRLVEPDCLSVAGSTDEQPVAGLQSVDPICENGAAAGFE